MPHADRSREERERAAQQQRAAEQDRVAEQADAAQHERASELRERSVERERPMERSPSDGTVRSWQVIKSRFVDDPEGALAAAEDMVQHAVDERIQALKSEASALCARERDEDASSATESMRTRLIRYQEYCERLMTHSVH